MPGAREHERARAFLARLADPDRPLIHKPVAIVLAHPDDETIGLGAQFSRFVSPLLVIATDGAPRNLADARAAGFDTPDAYAAARREELGLALARSGASLAPVHLDVPDQEAVRALPRMTERLVTLLRGAGFVFTHAYEGGHPDHDALACAVHRACASLGGAAPTIIEMPFYRAGPNGDWLVQDFTPGGPPETRIALTPDLVDRKRAMLAAHATQAATLTCFSAETERFRPAPAYDFATPPNGGDLLYARMGWMRWADWRDAAFPEEALACP